jgi:hypothetical protein
VAGGVAFVHAGEVVSELLDVFQARGQCITCAWHVDSVDPCNGLGLS